MRFIGKTIVITIILCALASILGCALSGDKNPNLPPIINFVNNIKDANQDSSTASWVLNMPFTLYGYDSNTGTTFSLYNQPYQLVQFPDLIVGPDTMKVELVPGEPITIKSINGADTTIYSPGTDYVISDFSTLIIQAKTLAQGGSMKDTSWAEVPVAEIADTFVVAAGETTWFNIDTLTYLADFKISTPNYSVFSYAPAINWFGQDPDGFVEYYEYADIDENFAPTAMDNPAGYIPSIPASKWVQTNLTSTTIYLLSQAGDTTEHVVYIRCYDNDGAVSQVQYRTFFRSNQAPNTPQIKWDEMTDTEYDTVNYIDLETINPVNPADAVYDTLFCLDETNPNWNGIILRWRGDDPDDKELYTIPLNFTYSLDMADINGDFIINIPEFSNDTLSDVQDITIIGLETGWYRFTVYSIDDGFEQSVYPAVLYFRCVKPALIDPDLAHSILIYDETVAGGFGELPGGTTGNNVIDTFYVDMLERLEPLLANTGYGYDIEDPYDLTSGTQDVIYWNNSSGLVSNMIPVSLLGQFKMVLWYADDHKLTQCAPAYVDPRDERFLRYLYAGGRIMVSGRCLLFGSFTESSGLGVSTNALLNAMQVSFRYSTRYPNATQPFEFIGGINAVGYLDSLKVDTSKTTLIDNIAVPPISGGLPEVDWISRDEDATTLFYFNSITGALSEVSETGPGHVMDWTNAPAYPAPNGYQCWVTVDDDNVTTVTSVYNVDKDAYGEVISLTSLGEIFVSYEFVPIDIVGEASLVLNASSSGGSYTNPTPTGCYIRTQKYDQIFTKIYNVDRDSYAEFVASYDSPFDVQISYPDTVVTIQPGHPDYVEPTVSSAMDTSCVLTVTKSFIDQVLYVHNVTQNWAGEFVSKNNNVLTISYDARPGQQWVNSDVIEIHYTYHQYWEVGDLLDVDYTSDNYWEKNDDVVVEYTYNPVTEAHLKPCGIRYENYSLNFTLATLNYRTAVFTFPFYFMENDTIPGQSMGRVDKVFYNMLDWFLDPNAHFGN